MSQAEPCGRVMPRWSVEGGGQPVVAASMAGLPAPRRRVSVDPPLLPSGCRSGSEDGIVPPQVVPGNWRFVPPLVIVPLQFVPESGLETIVFFNVSESPFAIFPPIVGAELEA